MRHYVVVFLESRLFPGTWVTDHFVRELAREIVPELPAKLDKQTHAEAVKQLEKWENVKRPGKFNWTLEEFLLGRVAMLTALWYGATEKGPNRIVQYALEPVSSFVRREK